MNKIDIKNMRIIAQQGPDRLLVSYGNDQGSILYLPHNVLSVPMQIESFLARGYWKDYTGNVDLEKLLPDTMIEGESGGQLTLFRDVYRPFVIEKKQCIVFRQNDQDRELLYQEILQGRLRQGWGFSEKFTLSQGKDRFIQNYLSVVNASKKTAQKQWNVLSRMLHIKHGDTIIIPKQPDHHHFLIVKAKQTPDSDDCYEFMEPLKHTNDYRHVVHIDHEKIQVVHYDSLQSPLVIKRLLKSIAYSSPVNFVKKRDFKEAVDKVFLSEEKNSLVEAHPVQTKLQLFEDQLYKEWVKTVRDLTPSDFEKLVKKYMQDNGFEILKSNSYDRKGGDIDLLCSKEISIETPFEPKSIPLTYCIQIKKHENYTGAKGVEQLNLMAENLNLEDTAMVQKILISLADGFTEECVNLAGESNVLLLNGVEFAQLYFKSV